MGYAGHIFVQWILGCQPSDEQNPSTLKHAHVEVRELFTAQDMFHPEDANSHVMLNYGSGGTIYGVYVNGLSGTDLSLLLYLLYIKSV